MSKKLKVFGIMASIAGFCVSLIANAIDDRKMEEAIDRAVDEKFAALEDQSEDVSEEEND